MNWDNGVSFSSFFIVLLYYKNGWLTAPLTVEEHAKRCNNNNNNNNKKKKNNSDDGKYPCSTSTVFFLYPHPLPTSLPTLSTSLSPCCILLAYLPAILSPCPHLPTSTPPPPREGDTRFCIQTYTWMHRKHFYVYTCRQLARHSHTERLWPTNHSARKLVRLASQPASEPYKAIRKLDEAFSQPTRKSVRQDSQSDSQKASENSQHTLQNVRKLDKIAASYTQQSEGSQLLIQEVRQSDRRAS